MCGILGYVKGSVEIEPKLLSQVMTRMFISAQSRGRDATGFAYLNTDGHLAVVKQAVPASQFLDAIRDVDYGKVDIFIGHTRAATQGSPKDNVNNHPIMSKESKMALTHNGMIRSSVRLKQDGEVDSEAILRLVEQKSNVVDGIRHAYKNYHGQAAFAIIGEKFPDKLYLARDGNPLVLAYVKELDLILYASTEQIIRAGLSTDKLHYGFFSERETLYKALFEEVEDDTILVVKRCSNGHFKLKTTTLEGKPEEGARKWGYGIPSLEDHNRGYRVSRRTDEPEFFDTEAWREQE